MEEQKLTLTFLSEQTGVTLRVAKYNRGFILNSDEYLLYSSLFNVADTSNTSSLSSGAFISLLYCTNLPRKTIESLVTFIQTTNEIFNDPTTLTLEDWLVVCKLVERLQSNSAGVAATSGNHNGSNSNCINDSTNVGGAAASPSVKKRSKEKKIKEKDKNRDQNGIEASSSLSDDKDYHGLSVSDVSKCLEELVMFGQSDDTNGQESSGSNSNGSGYNSAHSSIEWKKNKRNYADFWQHDSLDKSIDENGNSSDSIQIGSMGWEKVVENELKSHYTYKFKCKTDSCKYSSKEWTIVRRFSDFDTLCAIILRQSHLGAVLPPLPPKFFSTDEKVASQREMDLLLFLREAVKYPTLAYSYEFKSFLEASPSGMDTLRQFYEKDFHRLVFSPPIDCSNSSGGIKIDSNPAPNGYIDNSSQMRCKEHRKSDNAVETVTFSDELAENNIKSGGQHEIVESPLSPQSEASSSSSLSTSSSASASIVSRASYWAGEASQVMGSFYLMASDSVEAFSKTASVQAATRTVIGAKGAMMNKIYGQHGNDSDELTDFDIFGPLMGSLEFTDGVSGRRYVWDQDDLIGAPKSEVINQHDSSNEQRRILGTKAITRTNRLSRMSSKADSLLECERLVCKAHSELSAEFMKLSDLEGNSSMGHVSASFDSSSYGKSLQKYASSRSLSVSQEFHQIFGNIRLLARYRESIRNTIAHREGYKKQLKLRQSHVKDAKIKSEKATNYAKELAETFAAQSNNKSPMKISKLSPNNTTDNVDTTAAITISGAKNDAEEKKNSMQSNGSSSNSNNSASLISNPQNRSLSTTTIMNFVSMVSDKIVGKNDSSTPLTANQVFNAQASSAKAIKDLEKEEMVLHCLGNEANSLQVRMESDLVCLEQEQRRVLQEKLVQFVKLRIAACKNAAQIWEDFGSRLESFGGDSLAHGAIDKFL